MPKPPERNFLEAFLTNAEVIFDSYLDNEAVRSVPVIGTALKLCKGVDDLRTRALGAKLAKFLSEPSLQSPRAKARMQRLASHESEQIRIGETLFLVIEKMTDLEKPRLLGMMFAAFLADVINASTLRRLTHAIDVAYIDDLHTLLESGNLSSDLGGALVAAGLVAPTGGKSWNDVGSINYTTTALALDFRSAYEFALNDGKSEA